MQLHKLLDDAAIGFRSDAPPHLEVAGIADDSRRVKPGDLFIARPGPAGDGTQFARDAVARGAVAVVSASPLPDDLGVPRIVVADAVAATAELALTFHGHPERALKIAAVTGTNGKTTTAYLVRQLLNRAGVKCGLFGTVEVDDGRTTSESDNTTPGAIDLARHLAAMRDNGCAAVAMEASSHALDQGRMRGLPIRAAGFTNLTGDHLDYHKTMDDYAAAKARLFEGLGEDAVAIVNADDGACSRMVRDTAARVVRFTMDCGAGFQPAHAGQRPAPQSDYLASEIAVDARGTRFTLRVEGHEANVAMPLIGRHNVQNALVAIGIAVEGFYVPLSAAAESLKDATGAPGRLQRVDNRGKPKLSILVDYAHTDDALENVLRALRPLTKGKLRVVFGCGGDRDAGKRPRMAVVARRLGDAVYVTSDNPRSEKPERIIDDILAGLPADERSCVVVEPDRRQAIGRAIAEADADDVVLIAGKGHEKYQIVGRERLHFDDVEEAEKS